MAQKKALSRLTAKVWRQSSTAISSTGALGPAMPALTELERRVDSGAAAVAFALHPTRAEQLMAVADAGRLMPPKSTLEPKLADGLLSHVLD